MPIDKISKAEFDKVPVTAVVRSETPTLVLNEAEMKALLDKLDKPLDEQKILAAKVKIFIDARMQLEMERTGIISDFMRRWIECYNDLLDRIHKNSFGEKTLNFHLHKIITPTDIGRFIRECKTTLEEENSKEANSDESNVQGPV